MADAGASWPVLIRNEEVPLMAADATKPVRVLVVEDEFLVRLTLTEALADEGFEVVEAETADAALPALAADPDIRLLLTDVLLPGTLDGIGLAERARALRPELAVIFMTGRPDSVPGTRQSDNEAFIAKPYLPSEVTAAVRRLTAADG
jgi:DNA-binding response OmpR family regulator